MVLKETKEQYNLLSRILSAMRQSLRQCGSAAVLVRRSRAGAGTGRRRDRIGTG